ncbi:FAD-dependent oxidoreductase, partial [Verrucomicrobiota bacterium]
TVIERAPLVGGLAGCVEHNGNRYEFGTHVLHTDQPELRKRVLDLMGDRMFSFDRGSRLEIKFRDRYYPFPLNGIQVMRNLPPGLSLSCILSFVKWLIILMLKRDGPKSTEEYLELHFGRKLYEVFFKDYTRKFWGVPCSELDPRFGQERIPRSDVVRVFHDLVGFLGLQKMIDRHPLVERSIGKLYYTSNGLQVMFQTIADKITSNGGRVITGATAVEVNVKAGAFNGVRIETVRGEETIAGDYLISSIPITTLSQIMSPSPPPNVLGSANQLRYLPLKVCGLLINRKSVRNSICTYYRDKIFNRLSEPTTHGLLTAPPGKCIVLAEMTPCSIEQCGISSEEHIRAAVIDDMAKEGLIHAEDVLDSVILDYDAAYPVYLLGYRKHLDRCLNYIGSLKNARSVGRQGQFVYVNIHITMKMGCEAAREVDN